MGLGVFVAAEADNPLLHNAIGARGDYWRFALAWPAAAAAAFAAALALWRFIPRGAAVAGAILVALHVADMAAVHYRLPGLRFRFADTPPNEVTVHPRMEALRHELRRTGERVLAADGSKNQFLLPNLTRAWQIPAASGTGSLGMERYQDMFHMGGPGDVEPDTLTGPNVAPDLFSVRYALVPKESPVADALRRGSSRWRPVEDLAYYEHDPDTHYTLFRNEAAQPRAWCAGQVARVATRQESLTAVRSGRLPDGRPFNVREVAVVEEAALPDWPAPQPGAGAASEVVPARAGAGGEYRVTSSAPCVLVVAEPHHPWWHASVGGDDVTPLNVNHGMVGVPLPAGSNVVHLSIFPTSLLAGAAVSLLSLIFWIRELVRRRIPAHASSASTQPRATR